MFAKVKGGVCLQFPYTDYDLKLDNPYTKYPANFDLAEVFPTTEQATVHGCSLVAVVFGDKPQIDPRTQRVVERPPALVEGVWTVQWAAVDLSEQELSDATAGEASRARALRKQLLAASDWTQIADSSADKTAWGVYRQALRDISAQAGFPWNIDWPVAP